MDFPSLEFENWISCILDGNAFVIKGRVAGFELCCCQWASCPSWEMSSCSSRAAKLSAAAAYFPKSSSLDFFPIFFGFLKLLKFSSSRSAKLSAAAPAEKLSRRLPQMWVGNAIRWYECSLHICYLIDGSFDPRKIQFQKSGEQNWQRWVRWRFLKHFLNSFSPLQCFPQEKKLPCRFGRMRKGAELLLSRQKEKEKYLLTTAGEQLTTIKKRKRWKLKLI